MIAAVHITKSATWHGHVEEWENVYHYETPTITSDDGWNELVDAVVAQERTIHSGGVNFVRARVHGPTDTTQAEDVMRFVKDLSGVGTLAISQNMAHELAVVGSIYLGRSTKGYKVFLRKYWHSRGIGGTGATADHVLGSGVLGTNQKAPFVAAYNALKLITIGAGGNRLVTPKGRPIPLGTDAKIADYVHTRQFKRGRKRKSSTGVV